MCSSDLKNAHSFSDIFTNYDSNPAIKELVDDVMEEQALGQGKGEFGLNVLSKSVTKAGNFVKNEIDDVDKDGDKEEKKGDLLVKHGNKWIKVEVKTTHGGAARFSDQEVRPAEGYEAAASELNGFVRNLSSLPVVRQLFPKGIPAYGVNINVAMELYKGLQDTKHANNLYGLVENLITLIFGGKKADHKMVKKIMQNFKAGNVNEVLQLYSQASFNYYMSKKDDAGVLGIDLNNKSFIFYSQAADLAKAKMRLHTKTIYLSARDANRGAYPQLSVVPTTFGANAKAAAEKKAQADAQKQAQAAAKANPMQAPTITSNTKDVSAEKQVNQYVKNLAHAKGVFDEDAIEQASVMALSLFLENYPPKTIASEVNKYFVQFKNSQKPSKPTPAEPMQMAPADQKPIFSRPR